VTSLWSLVARIPPSALLSCPIRVAISFLAGRQHFFKHFWLQNYCVFGLSPSSGILGTRKQDISETGCFHPQMWVGRHLRMETDQVSEMYFLVPRYWMMEKVNKPSNSECDIPLSEPFRIYFFGLFGESECIHCFDCSLVATFKN
jgi:hypothetical protein